MYNFEESKYDNVQDFENIISVLLEFRADPTLTGKCFSSKIKKGEFVVINHFKFIWIELIELEF